MEEKVKKEDEKSEDEKSEESSKPFDNRAFEKNLNEMKAALQEEKRKEEAGKHDRFSTSEERVKKSDEENSETYDAYCNRIKHRNVVTKKKKRR